MRKLNCTPVEASQVRYTKGNDTIAMPFEFRIVFHYLGWPEGLFLTCLTDTKNNPTNSDATKVLVLKFPILLPEEAVKLSIWNGSVNSWFGVEGSAIFWLNNFVFTSFITVSQSSVKGKTIIQVNVDAKNILAEFTFDTERFSMDDFDECK